jgi:hypothetical protein
MSYQIDDGTRTTVSKCGDLVDLVDLYRVCPHIM